MPLRCHSWRSGLGISCLGALLATGLGGPPGNLVSREFASESQAALAQAISQASDLRIWPDTKTMTVVVEGEPQMVTMQLYTHPDMPLVTYYPPAMATAEACDQDGCFISFTYEDLGAAVLFLFPGGASSTSQVEALITGEDGLLADSGWTVNGEYTEAAVLRYPWAKKAISFQAGDYSAVGIAYLGELDGVVFSAIEVFPPDAGDGFAPQANAIFSEMQLR